jgi:hypothetical protein
VRRERWSDRELEVDRRDAEEARLHAQFKEAGAHTWINWRDYLAEFAPQLFP